MPTQPDISTADWWAAHGRRNGSSGEIAPVGEPLGEIVSLEGTSEAFEPSAISYDAPQPLPPMPTMAVAPSSRRLRGSYLLRLWAFVKMASLAYTTWWAMGYIHASPGATVSGYGAVCLFAGFGARWRKRFFGPGQIVEPGLYEEIGRWMYRLGVVLVLIGGAVVSAQTVLGGS